MKLALLGPIAWRTPPRNYGPWELVAGLLADGLVARGIDVTLFATLDSITEAKLDGVCPRPYEEEPDFDGRIYEALHVAHALGRADEFDLIHNHLDWLPLAFSQMTKTPMVTTIHGFSSPQILPAYQHSSSAFISISDADRSPDLNYLATVHHGVDVESLPFTPSATDALICFGRIHPDKGTAEAIKISRRAQRPLLICGPIQDERYYAEEIEPHVDDDAVRYLGSVEPRERAELLGQAACLLHPISFDEPFGLSVVESMICGTPVVAYPRGSMPEIIEQRVTGLLTDDIDSAVAAVDRVASFDRAACRAAAVRRFSVDRMVDDYLRVYDSVLLRGHRGISFHPPPR